MSFDKLDRKVQEAAEQYNASYNEDSWNKMEALLDEHMPQIKEEKRKFPVGWIFLLLFIMAGSVVLLLINPKARKTENMQQASAKKVIAKTSDHSNNTSGNIIPQIPIQQKNISGDKLNPQILLSTNISTKETITKKSTNHLNSLPLAYQGESIEPVTIVAKDSRKTDVQTTTNDFEYQKINNISINNKKLFAKNISINKSIQNQIGNLAVKTRSTDKRKGKFDNLFSLNFSAGPDVSAVDANNIGTVKLLYGAGIGYSFRKRWQIKAGVYAVKKVYDAMPSDYHPPTNFWNYYPGLEDVRANCNVIEVPLVLNYIFSQQSRQDWFVSAGVSSYFMKKETYNYHSKIAPGQYQDKIYTIKNQNEHYLSSLRLSAGYEKKVNKTISLSAEPYVNIPLSGVGYGKVKLNSAGLLFSVSVKPFIKK